TVAVNNRNRRAPEALARDAPVTYAIGDRAAAEAFRLSLRGHLTHRVLRQPPTPFAAVHHDAVFSEGGAGIYLADCALLTVNDPRDHLANWQSIFSGELEIALVMGGHTHHRAGAVIDQHIIRDPDWQQLS